MVRAYTNVRLSDELDPIVARTKAFAQACFYRAVESVANTQAPAPTAGSIEAVVASFLRSQTSRIPGAPPAHALRGGLTRRALAARGIYQELQNPRFGRLKDLDFSKQESLAAQLKRGGQGLFSDDIANVKTNKASLTLDGLASGIRQYATQRSGLRPPTGVRLDSRFFKLPALTDPTSQGQATPPSIRRTALELKIKKIKCLDPVDELGVDWGTDQINMGGEANDSAGTNIHVDQFHIANFDRANPVHAYAGSGYTFAKFNLTTGSWPSEGRAFWAFFALAEKDADGGFLKFLQDLWAALSPLVVSSLTEAFTAAVAGAAIGFGVALPFDIESAGVAAAIGAAVGAIVGFVVSLILDALEDDIFEPIMATPIWLPSPNTSFDNGSDVSATYSDEITRDGASYKVWYHWLLI